LAQPARARELGVRRIQHEPADVEPFPRVVSKSLSQRLRESVADLARRGGRQAAITHEFQALDVDHFVSP